MKKNCGFRGSMPIFIVIAIITGCAGNPSAPEIPAQAAPNVATVAVWNLENLSINPGQSRELEEFLTNKVVETLKDESTYQIVEREKLLLALEELNIGSSALVDQNTGLRIGHIIGAQLMIFGAYQVIGDTMRIDLRMVDVETGKVLSTAAKTTSAAGMTNWLNTAEEAAAMLY